MGSGFMALAGSVSVGLCWDMIGPRAPFALGGTAALPAVVVGLALRRKIACMQ